MKRYFGKGAGLVVLGAATSTLVLAGTTAFAGTGIGGIFNLGQTNTVNASSVLAGSTGGDQLDVVNFDTGASSTAAGFLGKSPTAPAVNAANTANGPALALSVKPSFAPFTTNSTGHVANLNADQLDSIDSTGFVQGKGNLWSASASAPPGEYPQLGFGPHGYFQMDYACPSDIATPGTLRFINASEQYAARLFSDNGGANPAFVTLTKFIQNTTGYRYFQPAAPGGDGFTFSVRWTDGTLLTAWVFTVQRPAIGRSPAECLIQAQGVLSR